MSSLKDQIASIIDNNLVGTMATIHDNKPRSRYMTFFNDNLTLYTATSKDTHKTEDIEQNPYTHILLGYNGEGIGDEYVEIEGKVTESDDESLKKKVWNEHLESWFEGPEDPKLLILKVIPEQIRLMNKKGQPPQTLEL
ncbi:pyridoxamine 5'-phosphate oxidase family protein [Domibacillus sp. DTU_2020_1001157_1_SI_ALB_TIR_016]|uniref:pyridoxamine 5'-phosphate oxidase family protein n=1 Tax=Domibacillus sp. DTU_2020_1001157_1_SI_ALB_TIR_016 TaxID=3077789 RepID=UPI0028EF2B3C|nr:pyridoxamine 5'-phosphate oxidase family protein [Domibacillus sp. DTU_2020_1001157_1_SI_ALB_TIR_016]WNS80301.1 pyridoxamine 5'-phosphate oxidase family protein [Domibacillus sp. DTU_2020_1001157_1_SI_ALB_TIR_016]